MDSIQIWKLVIDGALVLSLVYLAAKFARPAPALQRHIAQLESQLRNLLQEAEMASRSLADSLAGRQRALEQLLLDLDGAESRSTRTLRSSVELIEELRGLNNRGATAIVSGGAVASGPSHRAAHANLSNESEFSSSLSSLGEEEQPKWSGVNIYGEPIRAAAKPSKAPSSSPPPFRQQEQREEFSTGSARESVQEERRAHQPLEELVELERECSPGPSTSAKARPLAASLEKEVTPYGVGLSSSSRAEGIQRIYDSAEELLRNGQSLQDVAGATMLPLDEVKVLSNMIERERVMAASSSNVTDDRLGVLSSMKREILTI